MKANDCIPLDEILLAEAIAAAKSRRLRWCSIHPFECNGQLTTPNRATAVCALGALYFAGKTPLSTARATYGRNMVAGLFSERVWDGNDNGGVWAPNLGDCGESLGYAFRCAMTEELPPRMRFDDDVESPARDRRGRARSDRDARAGA